MSEYDREFWTTENRHHGIAKSFEQRLTVEHTNPVVQYFGRWPKRNPRKMVYRGEPVV